MINSMDSSWPLMSELLIQIFIKSMRDFCTADNIYASSTKASHTTKSSRKSVDNGWPPQESSTPKHPINAFHPTTDPSLATDNLWCHYNPLLRALYESRCHLRKQNSTLKLSPTIKPLEFMVIIILRSPLKSWCGFQYIIAIANRLTTLVWLVPWRRICLVDVAGFTNMGRQKPFQTMACWLHLHFSYRYARYSDLLVFSPPHSIYRPVVRWFHKAVSRQPY